MPMYLYENHGVLITETPAVVGEEFIPTDDNGARVYEFGMPSTIDEQHPKLYTDITAGEYLDERLREIGLKK